MRSSRREKQNTRRRQEQEYRDKVLITPRPQVGGGSRATCGRFVRVDSLGPSRSGRRASIFRFRLVGRAD